jgi:OOP family OmpA-OmpF porin
LAGRKAWADDWFALMDRMRNWRTTWLALTFFVSLAAAAESERERLFGPIEAQRAELEAAQGALLAPVNYLRGVQALERASADYASGADQGRILQRIDDAFVAFDVARAVAERAKREFTQPLASRNAANDAEAFRLAAQDWSQAEKVFGEAVRALEKDDLQKARDLASEADAQFRVAELTAIKARVLGEARSALMDAEQARAEKHAPITMEQARALLARADAALEADRYALEEPVSLAAAAAREAGHASAISALAERVRRGEQSLESLILDWESPLRRLAETARLDADLSNGYGAIEEALRQELQRVPALTEELAQARQQVLGLEEEIRDLDEQIGGANAERNFLVRRLEAQARVREQFASVEALFTPEEARVLRDGDKLIIRLVGLRFASSSAALDESAIALLGKLQDAINVFPRSRLFIEGHTDSSGDARTNERLSAERADAVANFIVTELGVPAFRVTAEGFGAARPLANNQTSEGRAQNRRIDVIIEPQLDEGL